MSKPLTVLINFSVPAENTAQLVELLRNALPKIRSVDGCSGATLLTDSEREDHVMLVEQWASVDAHQAHVAALQEEGMFDTVVELAGGPPTWTYHREVPAEAKAVA